MNFYGISVLFLICFSGAFAEKWTCDKNSEKKLDIMMSKLLTFGTSRKYPVTKSELKPFCTENYKLINKIEEYNKQCMPSEVRQTVGIILFSIRSLVNQYCKKNMKFVDTILTAAPCANKARKEFNKCHMDYIDALKLVKDVPNSKDRLPLICCEYHRIFDCVHNSGRKVQGCTDRLLDTCEDFVRAHFERVFNMLCADYSDTSDRCDKVPKILETRQGKNLGQRPKTFILPLVSLLTGGNKDE